MICYQTYRLETKLNNVTQKPFLFYFNGYIRPIWYDFKFSNRSVLNSEEFFYIKLLAFLCIRKKLDLRNFVDNVQVTMQEEPVDTSPILKVFISMKSVLIVIKKRKEIFVLRFVSLK